MPGGPDISTAPTMTSPDPPSMDITVPASTRRSPSVTWSSATTMSGTPTTAGIPHPRATTAAWLVTPPRAVRIPTAILMPTSSVGVVSSRTSRASSSLSAASNTSSVVRQTTPMPTPGLAPVPTAATCGTPPTEEPPERAPAAPPWMMRSTSVGSTAATARQRASAVPAASASATRARRPSRLSTSVTVGPSELVRPQAAPRGKPPTRRWPPAPGPLSPGRARSLPDRPGCRSRW